MKIIMKPIQVYALWREDGAIQPLAFCLTEEDEKVKVALGAVKRSWEERLVGRKTLYFDCDAISKQQRRPVCLRYDIAEHRWYLHKA